MFPVTLVAVVVAMATTAIAWRLSRGERRRSEARISALTAALAGPDPGDFRGSRSLDSQVDRYRTADRPAAVPVVAPVVPDVQTRPIARQATVTHGSPAVAPPPPPRPRAAVVRSAADIPLRFGAVDDGANAAPLSGDLFEPRHSSGGLRLAMVLGFGLLVGAGALYIVFGGEPADGTTSAGTDTTVVTHAPAAAEPPALELVSLRHSRQGDTWTIAGMVRNPADAPELQRPAAIAFLFDKEGGFVGSGRATIELNTLSPGDESPFVVSVTATGPVERYRISFRSADGKVLRHVDRRNVPRS